MNTLSGLTAGAWNVDASHSEIGFSVRHLMVGKIRRQFKDFELLLCNISLEGGVLLR